MIYVLKALNGFPKLVEDFFNSAWPQPFKRIIYIYLNYVENDVKKCELLWIIK